MALESNRQLKTKKTKKTKKPKKVKGITYSNNDKSRLLDFLNNLVLSGKLKD